jgi:hypothetical protein
VWPLLDGNARLGARGRGLATVRTESRPLTQSLPTIRTVPRHNYMRPRSLMKPCRGRLCHSGPTPTSHKCRWPRIKLTHTMTNFKVVPPSFSSSP